jgi:hypothetical protein
MKMSQEIPIQITLQAKTPIMDREETSSSKKNSALTGSSSLANTETVLDEATEATPLGTWP